MDEQIDPIEELSLLDLVQETFREHERTLNEMHEIGVLVKQSAAEVERLSQQNTRVGTYLRQLHTNFDTIPREDIKEGYGRSSETPPSITGSVRLHTSDSI